MAKYKRLTVTVKGDMVRNFTNKAFSRQWGAIHRREENLAESVYNSEVAGYGEAMAELPEKFFPTCPDIHTYFGGQHAAWI